MTNLPPSNSSSAEGSSSAFGRLHPSVQRWIWTQSWQGLRDIQESAVDPILDGSKDVIIAAPTASGKTEAAFLPICSRLMDAAKGGVQVLYIAPLKALINDQFERLEGFCEELEIPVHRWHGDVAGSKKKRLVEHPEGILLITPESFEGLFVHRATRLRSMFSGLLYVVVDELHSFIGTERGRQLQSLLNRLERALQRRVPRVALSATIGDLGLAAESLRPREGAAVQIIHSQTGGQELQIQIRGYRVKEFTGASAVDDPTDESTPRDDAEYGDLHEIGEHLFKTLRGTDNLVFANQRRIVEEYADFLRRICEKNRVPNEFLPHHGSLAKELREDVESRLKDKATPETIICTTTLEMGIDIGHVASVAQISSPPSVAALRQRLGRSGRRGEPARIRIYVPEPEIREQAAPYHSLRDTLVQAIAMVQLLIEKWCEPPIPEPLHLSTLVQQVMSLIAQKGGVSASEAWVTLCETGPFSNVEVAEFTQLLKCIGGRDLIVQEGDGTLLLGIAGERIVNHYTFYAVFETPQEYRIVSAGRNLGTLSLLTGLVEGEFVIFAGKRWLITAVDHDRKVVDVKPAAGGRTPRFEAQSPGTSIHDRVREQMLSVYQSEEVPVFLDERARDLLGEGRANFRRYGLDRQNVIPYGRDSLVFLWMGDRVINAVWGWLRAKGLRVDRERLALLVSKTTPEEVLRVMTDCVRDGPPDPLSLIQQLGPWPSCKYDRFIERELLERDQAGRFLDTLGAWQTLTPVVKKELS